MIRLNCFIRVSDGHKAEAVELARRLVEASLSDAGCVAYDLFESATREDVMMICETWADQASLDAHSASAHFTDLVPRLQAIAEMKLESFDF